MHIQGNERNPQRAGVDNAAVERMDGTATLSFQGDSENPPVMLQSSDNSSSSHSTPSPAPVSTPSVSTSSTGTASSTDDTTSCSDLSLSDIFGPNVSHAPTPSSLLSSKLVGDNIDKNIKPQDMRIDNQTKSLHYFHVYNVRDRIDLNEHDDEEPTPDISSISIDSILPSAEDDVAMHNNYSILIARVLRKHMPFLKKFGAGLERHIRHEFYEDMSAKSEVVSTDVLHCTCTTYLWVITVFQAMMYLQSCRLHLGFSSKVK